MSTAQDLQAEFSIDEWRVLPDRGIIESENASVHLEPKVMAVLLALASGKGAVVSKKTLVDEVWDGRAVSDIVITRCISILRSSLGDNPRDPRFIETLPKRGYRLLPEVVEKPAAQEQHAKPKYRIKRLLAILSVVVICAILYWAIQHENPTPALSENAIAVLPLVNMSGPEQQYLCDGIREQLIVTLAESAGLKVAARTSSNVFRDSQRDIRDIARELGVGAIIEGSVRRAGNTVRVSAQLIDSESGYQLWSGSYDEAIEDTFDLQERISNAIVAAIQANSGATTPLKKPISRPENFAAYDKFLLGRYTQNQRRSDGLTASVQMFEESIAQDPNYGPSYLGLAYTYALLPSYLPVPSAQMYDKALATLDAGIAADANIAGVGAAVQGFVHFKRGEWSAAETHFKQALASRYVEPTSYQWYSQLLATVGRKDRSLALALQGREIDPLSPVANSRLAIAYLWVGENAKARHYLDIAETLDIESPIHKESTALLLLREGKVSELEAFGSQFHDRSEKHIDWLADLVAADTNTDRRAAAIAKIKIAIEHNDIALRVGIVALAVLGATDDAANLLLTQAELGHSFEYEILFIDELADVRRHPAFQTIVSRLGLPEYWLARGCRWQHDQLNCD